MKTAPRTEGKVNINIGIKEGYAAYRKAYWANKMTPRYDIKRKAYGDIMRRFHLYMGEGIIERSETFKMPAGLPKIRVKKYKRNPRFKKDGTIDPRSLPVDWGATRKLWDKDPYARKAKKLVFYLNDHTDGYSFMVWMDKTTTWLKNISPYQFRPVRAMDKDLYSAIMDPRKNIDYYS